MATIEEILTIKGPDVVIAPSTATVYEAARLMADANVGSVIVQDGEDVLGIFTERDLLQRVVAAGNDPAKTPQFKGSYARVYGEPDWGVKFQDGTAVWDHFNDAWYLRRYPDKEIGFITFSNGKNDGGIGWPQAVEFYRALQDTRRPHLFVWGQGGHGQRATMPVSLGERVLPIDVRTDQTLPAFAHCSLDDNPGSGDPKDGDAKGQVNLYLYWETADIADAPERWEMTVGLIDKAPRDECTVDLTPRRCRKFKPKPGQMLKWTNASLRDNREIQTGSAKVDKWGLVTIEKLRVAKGRNRIRVSR